ncbi:unnamed protein product [Musa acuminata subsp. malaccensis]|uniref:(wild Malaysian banana) hypothetical protein n=1 Tax=Musa acuminata subsp. malaccensis TaxID=214687 RepID=A0A804ILM7_MUSAM|nr:unnamed protein product [Musa acuminata subsp. malaccensis]
MGDVLSCDDGQRKQQQRTTRNLYLQKLPLLVNSSRMRGRNIL